MDPFAYMAQHPDEAANFDAAMAGFTRQIAITVAASYDFSPFRRIVDVGGGSGALVAGILQANPALTGVLFDLPHVAERAKASIAALGLADRCAVVRGDFFKGVPEGGDAYLLKHVIHDWNDVRAAEILQSCRPAMGLAARLLIIEGVYPPRIDQSEASRGAAANEFHRCHGRNTARTAKRALEAPLCVVGCASLPLFDGMQQKSDERQERYRITVSGRDRNDRRFGDERWPF